MQPTLPISKSFWVKGILSLLIFAHIISCEKDEIHFEEVEQKRSFNVETITHKKASSNPQLLSSFENTKTLLSPVAAKSGVFHDTLNDMYILTDQVKHVTTGEYESYTYGVEKNDGTNNLYNLFFSKQVDGSFKTFMASYDMNKVTLDQLKSSNLDGVDSTYINIEEIESSFSAKLNIINAGGGNCIISMTLTEEDCGFSGKHKNGQICDGNGGKEFWGEQTLVIVRGSCNTLDSGSGTNGGGGNIGDDDPPVGDPGLGQTGGGNADGSGNNDDGNENSDDLPEDCILDSNGQCIGEVTTPVLPAKPSLVSPLTNDLFESLEQDEKDYINNPAQNEFREEVDVFLIEESQDEDSKGFAEEAIKEKRENEDTEVDFENKSIETSSIPDCVKNIINNLKPTNGNPGFDVSDLDDAIKNQLNLPLNPNGLANFPGDIIAMFNNDQNYGLKFKVGRVDNAPNGAFRNAITETGPTNLGRRMSTITLNQDYVNRATDLAIARTLIHELMHAYISYSINNNANGFIGSAIDNLVIQAGVTSGGAQHELMAQQFVDIMAASLAAIDNNQQNSIEYERLAWSGDMRQSDVYSLKSFNERQAIEARDQIESGDPRNTLPMLPLGTKNC